MSFLSVIICDHDGCTGRIEARKPSELYNLQQNWLELQDVQEPNKIYHLCPTHKPKTVDKE